DVIAATIGRDERNVPGAGAAGGLGFAIHTLLRGRIMPGIEEILEIGDFGKMIENADLVITGEGRIDAQTLCGKAPMGVMKRAKREGVPVLGICGVMEEGIIEKMKEVGFEDILPTLPSGTSRDEGMKKEVAEKNIRETIRQYMIMHHV
ncbi:MAG: glycerate kinase, partial [Muribaculaceae bacterium]|nr:glycerate kinase [Muribaculaceae bacterium]